MKTAFFLRLSALGLAAVLALHAAPKNADRIEVNFTNPEKFTDVKDSYMETEKGRDAILTELKESLQERAGRYLQDGQKLTVTFTDIDLAGDYEPGRGPRFDEIRIVKDIYPPRMDLSFKLTDADGKVIKEGDRKLRDLSFLMRLSINTSDPLRHDKDLLEDWVRTEFAGKNK